MDREQTNVKLIFDWDKKKARVNFQKHRVVFEEARSLFNDPLLLTYPDINHSDDEERYISIGNSARGRILLIVHTDRMESKDTLTIRIISCRKVTPSERQNYEEKYE